MAEHDHRLETLLADARAGEHPTAADQLRVRSTLLAAIAAGAAPTTGLESEPGGAQEAMRPVSAATRLGLGTMGKWWLIAALMAAGGGIMAWSQRPAPVPVSQAQPAPRVETISERPAQRSSPPAVSLGDPPASSSPASSAPADAELLDAPEGRAGADAHDLTTPSATHASPQRVVHKRITRPAASTQTEAKHSLTAGPVKDASNPVPAGAALGGEELGLIQAASRALSQHDSQQALKLLDTHRRRFPQGVFAQERAGLQVLALCAADRLPEGRSARAAFLRDHPQAPLSARVRAACANALGDAP